ncbi:restriction endonuclease subunit S [Falsigemmobacter intermedius]|uniref:Restriction endonuclease subunit S n=1 Tax=Falsigemmobacter intermedius TaxID=1553448 RepID=A0A3S3WDY7_9RHOB|nr:restriction endonuclease subunit S [Falsigemmobacter intermedius]RWY36613.1 restriction endonuclease subunit S [Falsigemmobacter intermedius]
MSASLFTLHADWSIKSLGEICSGGDASIQTGPFGSALHASDYVLDGTPCVMPQDIRDGKISTDNIARVSTEDHDRLKGFQLRVGDIVYPRRGDIVKRALVGEREAGWLCGTGCLRLRPNPAKAESAYLSYYLAHPDVCDWIESNAVGATMPHLNTGLAGSIPVVTPPLAEQHQIAAILGALDDKIELNRKTAATLEEMARAIYRSWFVDFDPVRAKAEGRVPAHMDAATADLFPDSFGDDGLPLGWANTEVAQLCSIKGGKQLEKELFSESGAYPVFGGAGQMGLSDRYNADGYVITVGRVGAYCGVFVPHRGKAWVNNNASHIIPKESIPPEFLLLALQALDLSAIKKGAAQPFISNGDLGRLTILLASADVLSAFNSEVKPMFERREALLCENQTLANLRDTLLPRLMSGELRVGAAKELI